MNVNSVTYLRQGVFGPGRARATSISRQWICKERATPPGPKRTAARRVAPNLAWGFVARRSQPHCRGMLRVPRAEAPRASPQAKLGATNVTVFTFMTTKGVVEYWSGEPVESSLAHGDVFPSPQFYKTPTLRCAVTLCRRS